MLQLNEIINKGVFLMVKKKWFVLFLFIVLISASGFWFYCQNHVVNYVNPNKEMLTTKQIKKNIASKLSHDLQNKQSSLTTGYRKKLTSSRYTLDNPFIKLNPYKTSPLTALIIFKTTQKAKIKISVIGKTAGTTITYNNSKYNKKHALPVLGLYANYNNKIRVQATYKNGKKESKIYTVKTAKLPSELAKTKIKVTKNNKKQMVIGSNKLTFIVRTTHEPFGMDADGAIRWFTANYSQHVFRELSNGHLLYLAKKDNTGNYYNEMLETDYLGRVYKEYQFSTKTHSDEAGTSKGSDETIIHHDAIELTNHNILATVSDGSKKYMEDTIVEISHKTGKIVNVIDMKKILPKSLYTKFSSKNTVKRSDGKRDWFHNNSLYYDKTDGGLVISSRNQDLVMKINYRTHRIKWIFSNNKKWPKAYRKYLLKTKGKISYPGGQHAAILTNTAGSVKRLLIFNNNISVYRGNTKTSKQYSQGVEYTINEKKKTIKEFAQYGKQLGKKNFSYYIGSNRYLSKNNRLIDFGYRNLGESSNIVEYNNKTKKVVFNATISNFAEKGYAYRAERMSLYPQKYCFDLENN
ncbi:arylsulfate sulfotransferase [Liquorilactobacillus aquaticus DSM 21051]|uniref:Arylsulfate sulfotransferase n=2 Tax=Liquorilactobacillus aquaticus TaxID=392566 RepID=A0A0R2D8S0_9LACO|nr:arylsulfate sulfotransferase [Liquorilactobacillus aquaticus DSM 21051]